MQLNYQWITENKEKCFEKSEYKWKWNTGQYLCDSAKTVMREICNNTEYFRKQENVIKQPKLSPKGTKKEQTKPKLVQRN